MLVQDDPVAVDLLLGYLHREGIGAAVATDGETGLLLVRGLTPDVIVVDMALPGMDGLSFCEQARKYVQAPVILLTSAADETPVIDEVALGVLGYLVAPIRPRELVQRIGAVLRRDSGIPHQQPAELVTGNLVLDQVSRAAAKDGLALELSDQEFDLLAFLMRNPGQVFRRDQLVHAVSGHFFEDPSSIAVHVHGLREKLEDEPSQPTMLVTVWGVGYRFDPRGAAGS